MYSVGKNTAPSIGALSKENPTKQRGEYTQSVATQQTAESQWRRSGASQVLCREVDRWREQKGEFIYKYGPFKCFLTAGTAMAAAWAQREGTLVQFREKQFETNSENNP